jgi:hypothetical protein
VRTGIERPDKNNKECTPMSANNTRSQTFSLLHVGGVIETSGVSDSVAGSRRWGPHPVGPQFAHLHLLS